MKKTQKAVAIVHDVTYHRNGVGGTPFVSVIFKCGFTGQTLVASVAGYDTEGFNPAVFVLAQDEIADGSIASNWRGDDYSDELTKIAREATLSYYHGEDETVAVRRSINCITRRRGGR